MGLFTDGPPSSIEDLAAQDSQLLNVSTIEGIDVSCKLALAWEEVGAELSSLLSLFGSGDQWFGPASAPSLGMVVITPSLKLWHTFRALEMVYADAYHCQLNDRYAGKRNEFGKRARRALETLRETGVGIARLPVPKAAQPVVVAVTPSGAALPDGTYYATVAWINRNAEEGVAADAVSVSTGGNTFAVEAGPAPENATGWNVYAGADPCGMALQNECPLAPGVRWVQGSPLATGRRLPGVGQGPNCLRPIPRAIQRG